MKKTDGKRCPKCGSEGGFHMSRRVGGWWVSLHHWNGETFDTSMESMVLGQDPETVRCADCSARIENPLRTGPE